MRYLLVHNGQFWTGDRFSIHIMEGKQYSQHHAVEAMKYLTSRFNISTHLMEAPPTIGDSDYST